MKEDWATTKEIMFEMEKNMPKALEGFGMARTGRIVHDMKAWMETTMALKLLKKSPIQARWTRPLGRWLILAT